MTPVTNDSISTSDKHIAAVRTVVKYLVPLILGHFAILPLLSKFGVELSSDTVEAGALAVGMYGYSLAVSFFETRVNPWLGVLAGIPRAPVYTPPPTSTSTPPFEPDAA